MSSFLQLCQALREEAGISGSGPASVVNQTGEMKRIVNWINRAYETIQTMHQSWNFMRPSFSFQTIQDVSEYLPTAVGISDHGSWKLGSFRCYLTSAGVNDEQWLTYYEWDTFRDVFVFGGMRGSRGRPIAYAVKPDQSIVFYPTPDREYTIVGERQRRAVKMVNNTDVPLFDEDLHDIVMWRALMYYAVYESAPELHAEGQAEFSRLLKILRQRQLPEMQLAGSLA